MPSLKVKDQGREFMHQVEGEYLSVGRAPSNTIAVGDAKASKEHFRLERVGDRWKMIDLESKNGTRVNGAYRNKAWLNHGDKIRIGTSELRFRQESSARASAPASAAAPSRAAAPARAAVEDDYEPPPRPPRKDQTTDKLLKYGGALLGTVLLLILALNRGSKSRADTHNKDVLKNAQKISDDGDWERAIAYLEKYGDPGGGGYYLVQQRINDLRKGLPSLRLNQLEVGARRVASKLGNKIKAYHNGKVVTGNPDDILALVNRLKTDFAGTETTRDARERWPAWFAGKVPERGIERLGSKRAMEDDWNEAQAAADKFRKELHFLEARETIEKFLTTREAILSDRDLTYYRDQVEQQLRVLDNLADSVYRGRERAARDLVKKRRYDQAIAVFREVIEKFGIDLYLRKAQGEISKIQELKASGK